MSEPSRSRWLDSDGSWQQGPPPVGYWQESSGLWFPPSLLHHPAARPVFPDEVAVLHGPGEIDDSGVPVPVSSPVPSPLPAALSYPPWLGLALLTTLAASLLALLAATHQAL